MHDEVPLKTCARSRWAGAHPDVDVTVEHPAAAPRAGRMLVAVAGWAGCFLLLSAAVRDAPALWVAAARALLAAAFIEVARMVARPRAARREAAPTRGTGLLVAALAVTNVALGLGAMASSATTMGSGTATVLANAQPLLVLVPAWAVYGERPRLRTLVALGAGLAGLAAAVSPGTSTAGVAAALLAAVALAVAALVARAMGDVDLLRVAVQQYLVGGLLLAVVATFVECAPDVRWTTRLVIVVVALAAFGTAVPFLIWLGEARRARVTPLAAWSLAVPVLGVLLAIVVDGERPAARTWAGYAVVAVSTLVVLLGEARR